MPLIALPNARLRAYDVAAPGSEALVTPRDLVSISASLAARVEFLPYTVVKADRGSSLSFTAPGIVTFPQIGTLGDGQSVELVNDSSGPVTVVMDGGDPQTLPSESFGYVLERNHKQRFYAIAAVSTPPSWRTPGDLGAYAWWSVLGDANLIDFDTSATYTGSILGRPNPANAWTVQQWTDRSGNARHFTQAVLGQRPLVRDGLFGGLPGVRFDGVDDRLACAFGATLPQPTTVWIAGRKRGLGLGSIYDGTSSGLRQSLLVGSLNRQVFAGAQVSVEAANTDATTICIVFNGAASTYRSNHNARVTLSSPGTAGIAGLTLGSRYDFTQFADLEVADMAVFNRALGADEEERLWSYGQVTYGTT